MFVIKQLQCHAIANESVLIDFIGSLSETLYSAKKHANHSVFPFPWVRLVYSM